MRKSLVSVIILLLLIPAVSAVNSTNIFSNIEHSTIGDIAILESKYDPAPAEPGNYVSLWVSVQNWGNDDLRDVCLRIKPEFPFYLDPWDNGIECIGILGAFKDKEIEFKLKVDEGAIEGDNTIDIVWCDDSKCQTEYKTKTVTINVKTGGSPDMLTILEDSDVFLPNSKGEATMGIINKGKLDIKFMTVTLQPSEDYEILSPDKLYIGELDSDDSDSAEFTLYMNAGKKLMGVEIITLPVKFEYSDANYKQYTEQRNIPLKVYSSTDAKKYGLVQTSSGVMYFVGLMIFIAIGYFGWKWWKKRNKKTHKS